MDAPGPTGATPPRRWPGWATRRSRRGGGVADWTGRGGQLGTGVQPRIATRSERVAGPPPGTRAGPVSNAPRGVPRLPVAPGFLVEQGGPAGATVQKNGSNKRIKKSLPDLPHSPQQFLCVTSWADGQKGPGGGGLPSRGIKGALNQRQQTQLRPA